MYQFLLVNKKYKYEAFFIDEYKELDDFMSYIEETIWNIIKNEYIIEKFLRISKRLGNFRKK